MNQQRQQLHSHYSFLHHSREDLQVAGNNYIACKYDEKWGIGLILEVDAV